MCLTVDTVYKKHNKELVVAKAISFTLKKGELGALIGPSGCGKTTLLRMIAGFETPDKGIISISGQQVFGPGKNIAAEHRGTGMVFQDYALFPHLSVMDNIGFGPAKSQKTDLDKLVSLTGLTGSENKYPHELSGGQQQRVALARALAAKPALLLMDEPFSNLDIALRETLSEEVRYILREFSTTGLLVTHNQHEAFAMADKIGVMKDGKLIQWDTGDNLYHHPATKEVAGFVGEGSFIAGNVSPSGKIVTPMGSFESKISGLNIQAGPATLFIRPEDIFVDHKSEAKALLVKSHFRGPGRVHTFELPSGEQFICTDSCPNPRELGKWHGISICNRRVSLFNNDQTH